MALTLYFHPLASYCQKALVALYEHGVAFEPRSIDLGDANDRAALTALWPFTKFPVLRDDARAITVPESSIVIEYIDMHYAKGPRLIPSDPEAALRCRLLDRFFDLHVNDPTAKVVADRLRPPERRDPVEVQSAKAALATAYTWLEGELTTKTWALGDAFSMADCAASSSLFYAEKVAPFGSNHPRVAAYFARLEERPSVARVRAEAEPFMKFFPQG